VSPACALVLLSLQQPATTPGKVARVGAAFAESIRGRTTPVNSPMALTYLDHLARRLSAHIPGVVPAWTFEVVDQVDNSMNPSHEPLALPGGFFFVTRRLLLDVRSESELAGMIAHAMAHITRPDASLLASTFFTPGGWSLIPRGLMPRHHACQLAADQEAVRLTSAAGFDPSALAAYLSHVKPAFEDRDSRLAALRQLTSDTTAAASSSEEFRSMQTEMRALFPERPPRKPTLYR